MGTTISDTEMTSDTSPVVARFRPHAAADGHGAWVVTGVPGLAGRLLDRNSAITALTLAPVSN